MRAKAAKVYHWLDERLSLTPLREFAEHKTVPMHRYSVLYYFGGMTLFFFLMQVVTGILLMLYYRPSAEEAFESVEFIMTTVEYGWLIRSVHSWSANLMVFFIFVHLATVYFMKGYRSPREITWITGCLLLFLSMGFGFSGYLLPWNQLSFFATKVGTDIPSSIPVVGEWTLRFLRGGDQVTGGTLSRFYGWHVAILPFLTAALLGLHLLLVQTLGMSVPPPQADEAARRRPMKFFPNFALRDLFGWVLALGVLIAIAALFPWELGEKADPFAPAYANIAPEWYFMFMFQTLKLVPGGELLGIEYEAFPILGFGLAGLLLVLVPFLDKGVQRNGKSPVFTLIGVVSLAFIVGMTAWGYHSLVPVWIVLGTGVLTLILSLGTRRVPRTSPKLLLPVALLAAGLAAPASAQDSSCVACHGDADMVGEEMAAIVEAYRVDVHSEVGLSCHSCHGGNPDPILADDMFAAMDPDFSVRPYVGAPARTAVPGFCGGCHSDPTYMKRFKPDARVDQEAEYWTSQHGKALAAGDDNVATCIDCHGVHGILRPEDTESPVYATQVAETCGGCHSDPEHMEGYTSDDGRPLPVDQVVRWKRSVHAVALLEREDLFAPTCNDCHGNHGATPPGLDSVSYVCGQCHGREAGLFRASNKHDGFQEHNEERLPYMDEQGCGGCHEPLEPQYELTTLNHFSECSTCHGNHAVVRPTVGLLAPLPETPCALCHEGPSALEEDSPEPEEIARNYAETRNHLLQELSAEGLRGEDLFDRLVEEARRLPTHTIEGGVDVEGNPLPPVLRPEFGRLFEKFRIGKTHFTYPDPVTGEEVRQRLRRCTDCHGDELTFEGSPHALNTAREFLTRMQELTVLTARAERVTLAARRGGLEMRDSLLDLDKAVDSQIELEVLVHTFSTTEGSAFIEKQAEGLEFARSALAKGRAGIEELEKRRRGLAVWLVLILVVLIALGLKIRDLSVEGRRQAGD